MYITLHFSRYSLYLRLIDGTSLVKTKLNRLINSVGFRMRSITKKAKHVNYSVKKYTVKSTVHGTLKQYGKYSISLLMPK